MNRLRILFLYKKNTFKSQYFINKSYIMTSSSNQNEDLFDDSPNGKMQWDAFEHRQQPSQEENPDVEIIDGEQFEGEQLRKKSSNIPDFTIARVINRIKKQNRKKKSSNRKLGRKNGSKTQSDYKKNICGYITKKVMRQFTNSTYKNIIEQMCEVEHIDYDSARNHYHPKIERVTGPSHLPGLFHSSKADDASISKVFLVFFKWFLKQRYIRHLFMQGKMDQKKSYIQYKNRVLLPLIYQIQKQISQQLQPASTLIESSDFLLQISQ